VHPNQVITKVKRWAGKHPDQADRAVDQAADAAKESLAGHEDQVDDLSARGETCSAGAGRGGRRHPGRGAASRPGLTLPRLVAPRGPDLVALRISRSLTGSMWVAREARTDGEGPGAAIPGGGAEGAPVHPRDPGWGRLGTPGPTPDGPNQTVIGPCSGWPATWPCTPTS
jgi:hypothetical protein